MPRRRRSQWRVPKTDDGGRMVARPVSVAVSDWLCRIQTEEENYHEHS
jgi:hypothetical protein